VAVDLGRFVGVSHFGDRADGRLRRQPEVIPKALVNDLLQVELADLLGSEFLKPQLRCRIAGSVVRLKSLPKQFCLVLRRCQLDIGHHRSNIETAPGVDQVSIWTLTGWIKLSFVCGERQRALLGYRAGEVDLMFVGGKWYLAVVCDMPDPEKIGIEDVLGVDFGVVNLAFDSEGRSYTGADVEKVRSRFALKRAMLQRRGTTAAKRRLKKLSGKEARFVHCGHQAAADFVGALNIRSKGVRALGAALVISAPEALRVVQPREMLPPGGEGESSRLSALR
jgi:hypothetical protein